MAVKMVVIDASVAVKWFLPEKDRPLARKILLGGESIVAPDLVVAEVMNVVWKNVRLGNLDAGQLDPILDTLSRAFSRLETLMPLAKDAIDISRHLDHPVYDCFYIALAQRERCELITADDRLCRKTQRGKLSGFIKPLSSVR